MKSLFILSLLILCFASTNVGAADPNALTDQEKQQISRNCLDAQRNLQRVQYVDPIIRVNRGSSYASMAKLMSALASRAAFNAYSVPQLSIETNSLQQLRQQFANDYTNYEIDLREIINFGCADEPVKFYSRLVELRDKRAILSVRIKEIDRHLDQFTEAMVLLDQQIAGKVSQ